jgi:hypothetical protein
MSLALRLYAQFADQTTFANVFSVIERCRRDVAAAGRPAEAERVERLARQRLARLLEQQSLEPSLPG